MRKLILFVSVLMCISCSHQYESDTLDLSSFQWNLWLDKSASWEYDSLYLPPVNLADLPVNRPTIGWDALHRGAGKNVSLPATVEEHFWGENGHPFGVSGNYSGVSWFTTRFTLPDAWNGKQIVLKFECVRLRAEVYVNEKLAGYDIINGTPFEVNITDFVRHPGDNNLAVRITDPNGNFAWRDWDLYRWGSVDIAPSHGFGGITGSVAMQARDSVYISDVFIKNRPKITSVDLEVSISNLHGKRISGELQFRVLEAGKVMLSLSDHQEIFLEEETIYTTISLPDARVWSPDSPALYELVVIWQGEDGSHSVRREQFGFRWFEVRDSEGDKQFFLNDQRIVLRSAISWGHWPVNGIYPTPEMAEKQVRVAKSLGLNMLNFHRGIGQTAVLDEADRQGLLYYQEPGGYMPGEDEFHKMYKREKLLRMIKRDRNHPSLVIYNMINEANRDPMENEIADIQSAHELDNTRMITFTSTYFGGDFHNGKCPRGPAAVKMHMLPYDDSVHYFGYWDEHHAGGPGVYMDQFYNGPGDIYRHYDIREEIVFLGEDGAIGTLPRLELIKKELEDAGNTGWDGDQYISQYNACEQFMDNKGFRDAFPTVDALTTSIGEVAYYYQGRTIENFRIGNTGDGYVINGWEGTKIENHSGIVDPFRNPKADPGILAYYNRPLYVAVKLRNKVISLSDTVIADFFLVNEMNLNGNFFLRITTQDEYQSLEETGYNLDVSGGTTYGELLHEGELFNPDKPGYYTVLAQLYDGDRLVAEGNDRVFVVNYAGDEFRVPVAVLDTSGEMEQILKLSGIENLVSYRSFDYPKEKVMVVGGTIQPSLFTGLNRMNDPLIDWVTRGNTLIITRNADVWAEYLDEREVVDYRGKKVLERFWFGGNYFVRDHPLFEGLPVDCAFNWEYQALAQYWNRNRFGMRLSGEICVAGCFADHNRELYTAVGIIPVGEGQIILSSLDLAPAIREGQKSSVVAKQILLNFLKYGLDVDDYFEDPN